MEILHYFISTAQAVSLPDFSKTSDLPAFISSVYSFALTVVGIAVFIRILYAGFLMLTAAGNSSKWGDARTKMQNAVVGAILLFSAYLILYIINPDLVKNTFKFTIPSSTSTAPTTESVKTNATGGPVAVSGIVPAAGGVTSFHGLPIARAQEGVYVFTIKVTDRNGDTCRQTYNIEVAPNVAGELPGALAGSSGGSGVGSGTGSGTGGSGTGGSGNLVSPVNQTFSAILDKEAIIELARTKTHEEMVSTFGPGVEQFFGDNVKAEDIPASFGSSSYFAWALSLGGKDQEGNVVGNLVFHSGDWYKTEMSGETLPPAGVSGPTTPEISNYEGIEVTGMWIEQDYFNLGAGDQSSTRVRVWYSNDNQNFEQDSNVSVLVSNNQVATAEVNKQDGIIIIKGVGGGQTTITVHPVARKSDKSKDKSIKVRVVGGDVKVTSLTITSSSVTVAANNSVKISAAVHLSDGSTNPGVEIFSSKPDLVGADVDINGVITISASSLPTDQGSEEGTTGQSYQATLTIHPMLAGGDRSFDKVITVTVSPSEENKLPVPAPEPELPFYIFDLSSNRQLSDLTSDQIEELNAYFSDNLGVMPSSFIPGSWMAFQMNLGEGTPTSDNGLPLQAIVLGYQYQGGRYVSAFKVPTSNAVGVKIESSPDTVKTITDAYNKVDDVTGYVGSGNQIAAYFLNQYAPAIALKVGANVAYKSFFYGLRITGKVMLPVGIIMTGVELVNWYNNHRRMQHNKVADSQVADEMMAKIKEVTDVYNSNRAPDAEQEQKYHDAAVTIVQNLFYTSAPYFKLQRSLDSQRGYLDGYIRSMDQTLAQRTSSGSQMSKNIFTLIFEKAANILSRENILAEKRSAVAKEQTAALLNAVSAQEESGSGIIQIIQGGGCVINTKILPDAIEGTPYYAEIFVAGEAPFVYEIEEGSLPGGLSIVAAFDMPVLTIKNITAQRTPIYAFKVGDTFRLDLTGAKPNSSVYFRWFKNGTKWFYPGITPNSEGWSKYGVTDGNGDWANQAAFTSNEIGAWQEYAMVDGKVSRVIGFQVLAPEVKIIVSAPAPGTGTPAYSGGGYGGSGCREENFCENRETGERTTPLSDAEAQAQSIAIGSSDRCPGGRRVQTCTYSYSSSGQSVCDANQFATRSCGEEMNTVMNEDGTINTSNIPFSSDGSPPANVAAGHLYASQQMSGSTSLGGNNFVVNCRYPDQAVAIRCGNSMSGEYCLSGSAGFNQQWCAGNSKNPPAATPRPSASPTPAHTGTPAPTSTPAHTPTPIPAPTPTPTGTPAPSCADSGGSGAYGDSCWACNESCPSQCAEGTWDCFDCSATPPACP